MKKILFILSFTLLSFAQTTSDGLRLSYQGLGYSPRSIGMGNAFNSVSDDYSAFFFNPAGLGLIKKQEFSFGLDSYTFNNKVKFFNTQTTSDLNNINLSNITYVYPFPTIRGSFVLGLSYNINKDFTEINKHRSINPNSTYISYLTKNLSDTTDIPYFLILRPKNSPSPLTKDLLQTIDNRKDGNLRSLSVAGSLEIDKDLFFGIDIDFINGNYKQSNSFKEEDINGIYSGITLDPSDPKSTNFNNFIMEKQIKWNLAATSFKFGLLYQLKNIARFGFTLGLPTKYEIEENYSENANAVFNNIPLKYPYQYTDKVKYSIITPYNITISASTFKFNTLFALDLKYIDYSKIEIENKEGLSQDFVKKYNDKIINELQSIYDINIGAEHHIYDIGLRLRAGFITQNSAYKSDNSTFNKKFVTFGFGYSLTDYTSFDFGYVYGWWKDIGDNYGSNLSRNYQDVTYKVLKIGISTRF